MSVQTLQANLSARGFSPGPADNSLGPRTYQALADFATARRAPADTGAMMAKWFPLASIDSRDEIIEFVANVAHESAFLPREEGLNYSAERMAEVWPGRYAVDPDARVKKPNAKAKSLEHNPRAFANATYGGRMGNFRPDDGFDFRGRAGPQLTGREAYVAVGQIVGMPFEANPNLLLTPDGSMAAAVGFWIWKGIGARVPDTKAVRRAWNGGTVGLDDVTKIGNRIREIWP